MPGVRLTLCESGSTILVGNPSSAAGLVLASHAPFAVWLPNYLGGVCASINIPPPGGGAIHNFTDAEVAGIIQYPGCANCTANHPLPPPEEGSINFARCDTGEIIYILDPLTDPWTEAVLSAWVGQVRYFPTIDGGLCLVVGRNVLHPNPPTLLIDGSDLIVAIPYDDCPACELANPGELRFSLKSCCADETDTTTYYSTTNLAVFNAIPNFSVQYIPSILQCVTVEKNTPEIYPHTPVPPDFWNAFFADTGDLTCCFCLETNIRAICTTYPLRITSCCFPEISYGIKGKICGDSINAATGGVWHITNLPDTIPEEQRQGCWTIIGPPTYNGSTEDITIPLIILDDNNGGSESDCDTCAIKWPCPPPICYELIPCPGVITVNLFASNDLSAYVNGTVMVDGLCYTVQPGTENCNGAQVIEIFDTFTQCGDLTNQPGTKGCLYCDCPEGYIQDPNDPNSCIKNVCVTPTNNGQPYQVFPTDGGPENTWGDEGIRIYENITTKIFPLTLIDNPPTWDVKDDGGTGAIITWVPPILLNAFINRFSAVGIWPAEDPINEWVGITVCLNITEEKIYSLGMAADSQYILKHNGTQIIENITAGVSAYRLWSIYQITLPVGQHVFEFFALNTTGTGGMGFEVYNADGPTLQSISPGALPGVLLFSTKTLAEQAGPAYFYLGTNAYSCPPGYFLNNCDGTGTNLQCCLVPKSLPFVHCEPSYLVESCVEDPSTPPITTNTDLSLFVGSATKVCFTSEPPPFYTECENCDPDYTWIARPDGNTYEGDCRTPDNGNPYLHCYSPCTVFYITRKGLLFSLNKAGLSVQLKNLSGIVNSGTNIANTETKLWVLGSTGLILEFGITLSPINYTGGIPNPIIISTNPLRSLPPSVPTIMNPLCAINDTTLLGGFGSVVQYDISGATVVFTTLFALPNSGVLTDIVYSSNTNTIVILGIDSLGPFVGEYTLAGVQIPGHRAALSFNDFKGVGIGTDGIVYVVRNDTSDIYFIQPTPTWTQGPYFGELNIHQTVGGYSQNPNCTLLPIDNTLWPLGCYCIEVTEIPYTEDAVVWPNLSATSYDTCEECLKVCYALTTCTVEGEEPQIIIVDNDLADYVGQVIKFPRLGDKCWIISVASTCEGSITVPEEKEPNVFDTCDLCNPPPPVQPPVLCRTLKPGYDTPGCSPEYTERISCTFGRQAFDEMVQARYGIKICCDHEMDKWDVRWEILKLKAIFDPSLCETITPTPSMVLEITTYCEDTTPMLTGILTVVGGSGSYQYQRKIDGVWTNQGDVYYGPTTGVIETTVIDSKTRPYTHIVRVLDVLCCTLGSNVVTFTAEECECVPSIVSSAVFACDDPPVGNTNATVTFTNTFHCSSGEYTIQIYDSKTSSWISEVSFTGTTEGTEIYVLAVYNTTDQTILLRIIDDVLGTISNEFTIVLTDCRLETLVLSNLDFKCTTGIDGEIAGNIAVVGGSGNYALQFYVAGVWTTFDTIIGLMDGPIIFTIPTLGGPDAIGTWDTRIIDTVTLVTSNVLVVTIFACGNQITILSVVISCNGIVPNIEVSVEVNYDNTGNNFILEYYDGVNWITIATYIGAGTVNFTIPGSLPTSGSYFIRVRDTTISLTSTQVSINADCTTGAVLELIPVGYNIYDVVITYNLAYQVGILTVDLTESLFIVGPFLFPIALMIPSNPVTSIITYSSMNLANGRYYQIIVKDSLGVDVTSNIVLAP